MKVDSPLVVEALDDVPARAAEIEAAGYDGVYTFEGPHDPFFPLALAAEHTCRVDLMTAIAIAFARSPMTLANVGWDLQIMSEGRAILGLGSQIKAHVERRFSMPWSAPAARMRELVQAMRAIWAAWQDGIPLRFEGEHYRHTLMTPFFDPGPSEHGAPRVLLAGVGPAMTTVAGEVADGFLVHPFSTVRFLREHTWPALEDGLARAGRERTGFEVAWPVMVVTGTTEEELAAAEAATRAQIAFYGSTPAYRVVLDAHGWGDLQPELNRLSKQGRWEEMSTLVDDEVLETIAVRGEPDELPALLRDRVGQLVDRIAFNAPYRSDPGAWVRVLQGLRT
ncbi:MAG: LLM class F420-dependent oxidoreductase [Actinobacteria bacterium]|nr:LLM class F420-dependent oxidoreductase [Actinomycetota bacterium]